MRPLPCRTGGSTVHLANTGNCFKGNAREESATGRNVYMDFPERRGNEGAWTDPTGRGRQRPCSFSISACAPSSLPTTPRGTAELTRTGQQPLPDTGTGEATVVTRGATTVLTRGTSAMTFRQVPFANKSKQHPRSWFHPFDVHRHFEDKERSGADVPAPRGEGSHNYTTVSACRRPSAAWRGFLQLHNGFCVQTSQRRVERVPTITQQFLHADG